MDKFNKNSYYQKLVFSGVNLAKEIKQVYTLPDYNIEPEWYDKTCSDQTGFMSVTRLVEGLEGLSLVKKFIQSICDPNDVSHIQMFVTRPSYKGGWHLDGVSTKAAINIPLWGCNDGTIDWTLNEFEAVSIASPKTNYSTPKERGADFVNSDFSVVLDKVTIVRTNSWHRINNLYNKQHRVTASIRFKSNPEFSMLTLAAKEHWASE